MQLKSKKGIMLQGIVSTVAAAVFILYGLIPLVARTNPWILEKIVFLHGVVIPPFQDVKTPSKYGLKGVKNFYLNVTEEITIGAWHIPPAEIQDSQSDDIVIDGPYPIFLYLHGNTGTRAASHRTELYKVLVNLNYHVFTLDYRGYADSTGTPSEEGVVEDAEYMYNWIKQRSGDTPVFLWGHSLGSGVATRLAKQLCEKGTPPNGLVLESPFTNVKEAAANHPFSMLFRRLPWFQWSLIDPLDEAGVYFKSDKNIASVSCDVLILHAEDDFSVPFVLGKKLFDTAVKSRPKSSRPVEFMTYDGDRGYGHKYIYKAPGLSNTIRHFVARSMEKETNVPHV